MKKPALDIPFEILISNTAGPTFLTTLVETLSPIHLMLLRACTLNEKDLKVKIGNGD